MCTEMRPMTADEVVRVSSPEKFSEKDNARFFYEELKKRCAKASSYNERADVKWVARRLKYHCVGLQTDEEVNSMKVYAIKARKAAMLTIALKMGEDYNNFNLNENKMVDFLANNFSAWDLVDMKKIISEDSPDNITHFHSKKVNDIIDKAISEAVEWESYKYEGFPIAEIAAKVAKSGKSLIGKEVHGNDNYFIRYQINEGEKVTVYCDKGDAKIEIGRVSQNATIVNGGFRKLEDAMEYALNNGKMREVIDLDESR